VSTAQRPPHTRGHTCREADCRVISSGGELEVWGDEGMKCISTKTGGSSQKPLSRGMQRDMDGSSHNAEGTKKDQKRSITIYVT
jgi:hypothetical protein